ncbi:oxidoreductase [Wuchereria bancrofti]|uniref:Oxidoreductase n=1 Tax=Wuchereria bancrofti TaxID=6293 RepID=J9BKD9_WUCBA|nr:oxidoreductase [Wuchereria bancrofti]
MAWICVRGDASLRIQIIAIMMTSFVAGYLITVTSRFTDIVIIALGRNCKEAVALVTGGASGLGKATVQHLLKHGFKVAMLDLPSSNGAFLSKLINRDCLYVPTNITLDEEVKNGMSKIKDKFGHLNAVINCAGISFNCKTFSFNKGNMSQKSSVKSDLKKVLAVNVVGTFNVIRHALDLIAQNERDESKCRGVVINTSSFSSFEPQFGQASF